MDLKLREAIDYYVNNENETILSVSKKFKICNKRLGLELKKLNLTKKHKKIYELNENYFDNINNKNKAYWIGFILADGCLTNNKFKLVLSERDKDHLIKLNESLNSNHPIKIEKRNFDGKNNVSLIISNKKFYDNLIKLGIQPNKSTKEKIINMNKNYHKYFILGIYDGDGWIQFNKNSREIGVCSSLEICKFIRDYFMKNLNIISNEICLNNKSKNNNLYRVRFTRKNDIVEILNYLYKDSDIFLKRKYDKFKEYKKFYNLL